MIHLGDITQIHGYDIPPVDVITGGSPCQDLSVAGKRAGLEGERSGLFMEQIRIVKEMRNATGADVDIRLAKPRYMVWENVPGAFSSNKGKDFQAVLTEIIRIADQNAPDVPIPAKWGGAGALYDKLGRWSVAWRVHDAQFWGVPQRRKRIALVADFAGLSAPEILFVRKGLLWDPEQGEAPGKATAGSTGSGATTAGRDGVVIPINDKATRYRGGGATRHEDGSGNGLGIGKPGDPIPTLSTRDKHAVYDARGNGNGSICPTLTGDHQNRVTDYTALCVGNGQLNQVSMAEQANTLDTMHDQQAVLCFQNTGQGWWNESDVGATIRTPCGGDAVKANLVADVDCRNLNEHQEVSGTLQCKQNGGYSLNYQNPIRVQGAYKNAKTRSKALLLLQETYGEEAILKWGTAILERLQQTDILQHGVHESRISGEAEKWNELDDCALPRAELVTGWMLRDLWKQQKCGRSPQGWESAEQQSGQFAESLPKLSQQNSQACKDLFDMWQKGEGLWLLREALSEIQKIWKSLNGQRQSIYGHSIVRRLTPLEAERLQGYPDGWTDIGDWTDSNGKKHKAADSPRYKALGNSIATPFWRYLARRIVAQYEHDVTMGSLFDGIGGFPYVFQQCGCKPVWASEIEEFPMAVTKEHFPEEE